MFWQFEAVTPLPAKMCSCAHANPPKCTCANASPWLPVWVPVLTSSHELDLINRHSLCSVRRRRVKPVHSSPLQPCDQRTTSWWCRLVNWFTALRTLSMHGTLLKTSWRRGSWSKVYKKIQITLCRYLFISFLRLWALLITGEFSSWSSSFCPVISEIDEVRHQIQASEEKLVHIVQARWTCCKAASLCSKPQVYILAVMFNHICIFKFCIYVQHLHLLSPTLQLLPCLSVSL